MLTGLLHLSSGTRAQVSAAGPGLSVGQRGPRSEVENDFGERSEKTHPQRGPRPELCPCCPRGERRRWRGAWGGRGGRGGDAPAGLRAGEAFLRSGPIRVSCSFRG